MSASPPAHKDEANEDEREKWKDRKRNKDVFCHSPEIAPRLSLLLPHRGHSNSFLVVFSLRSPFFMTHLGQMVSIDFFTVPTITRKVLFVFVVLEHRRREVLHFHVTEHACAAWTSQQIVEAFANQDVPSICSEIETVSTAKKLVCESPHSR